MFFSGAGGADAVHQGDVGESGNENQVIDIEDDDGPVFPGESDENTDVLTEGGAPENDDAGPGKIVGCHGGAVPEACVMADTGADGGIAGAAIESAGGIGFAADEEDVLSEGSGRQGRGFGSSLRRCVW